MSFALNKILNVFKLSLNRNICTFYSANAYINQDWLSHPYPQNNNERSVAAKKYNLHTKEFECYDDEIKYGDYPKLPFKGIVLRDFHYPYDIPEHRRNFNEPVHIDVNVLGEDRYDAGIHEHSAKTVILYLIYAYGCIFFGPLFIFDDFYSFYPVTEKQYPWKNQIHYTFEKIK